MNAVGTVFASEVLLRLLVEGEGEVGSESGRGNELG